MSKARNSHIRTDDRIDNITDKSHVDRIRENYDTTDLGAIMGRFYQAVSWRE